MMTSEGEGEGEGEVPRKRRRRLSSCNGNNNLLLLASCSFRFNDSITADVKLHLRLCDDESNTTTIDVFDHLNDVYLYLHSDVLRRRSKYFSALLSYRWQREEEEDKEGEGVVFNLTHKVPPSMKSIHTHRTVIELFYSTDDVNFSETINTVSSALSIIHVAMEFMFEDCVKACIRLIQALPWTEEEEERVLDLIPLLKEEESQELIYKVSPVQIYSSNDMILRLIDELFHNPHQKGLVAMMLRDFSSRDDSLRLAFSQAFEMTLKSLKEALQSACSSKRRLQKTTIWVPKEINEEIVYSNDQMKQSTSTTIWEKEEEKTVAHCGDYLCWLVDMMIEWRVIADTTTLDNWIDQRGSLSKNLQKVSSHNIISPKFFHNVILCTWKLANAVATGSIVADTQVRIKLIKVWLPVVLSVKDMVLEFLPKDNHNIEEPFIKIISTLPMSESQELLLQCLGFRTHNVNDCPYLVSAYKSWFRRATTQTPKDSDNASSTRAHESRSS